MKLKPREYKLTIDGDYTPATIPMDRLALYMQYFAALLGHRKSVHFSRLGDGSVVVASTVEPKDEPKVQIRVRETQRHLGPQDSTEAYEAIDRLLRDDGATGHLVQPDGSKVIEFPGKNGRRFEVIGPVVESGALSGIPIVIGGQNDPVPVHLKDVDGAVHVCEARLDVARRLRNHLFDDPVRATGKGRWIRDDNGEWKMKNFRIADFSLLGRGPIGEIVERLSESHKRSEWADLDDPLGELEAVRDG